jgi:hypothetical protein
MLIKRISTVIATGSLLFGTLATPMFASTGAGAIGNGAESQNTVNVNQTNTSTAAQTNNATITNNVSSDASTGGNSTDFNTGGDSAIRTGGASNVVDINNQANSNQMQMPTQCNCDNGGLVEVGGNGAFSANAANLNTTNNTSAFQNNAAQFTNNVDAESKTGANTASDNTNGNSYIFTGPANNAVGVNNVANKNVMTSGLGSDAGTGAGLGSGTTLKIDNNGALSANAINANQNNSAFASQNNAANFANSVTGGAFTGDNDTDFNTSGNSGIQTGSAMNWTGVANMANYNVMSGLSNCGCATGDLFKDAGNGAFSGSTINDNENNTSADYQNNAAAFSNGVDTKAKAGYNTASDNTAGYYLFDDPNTVMTGNAASQTQVQNQSNMNSMTSNGFDMGGMNWTVDWNPSSVMGIFGL